MRKILGAVRSNFWRLSISYVLSASILYVGLPFNSAAQNFGNNDALKMDGQKIVLGKFVDQTFSKMSSRSFSAMKTQSAQNKSNVAKTKNAANAEVEYFVLNVEFKDVKTRQAIFPTLKKSNLKDAFVLALNNKFADVFVRTEAAWNALEKNPNVVRVEHDTTVTAPPPPPVEPAKLISQAVPEGIVRGGYKDLTGKNVIIAVLDTGIDFRHPDFITYDSQNRPTSRISYLWDTATEYQKGRGSLAPVKFPNGTSIGTLYTKDQLTAELRSTEKNIPATDLDGHGTACASVAAGNGNADKLANGLKRKEVEGVAPEADIIGVRLGYDDLENSYLLNAIAGWLEKVAGKTPLVISGSFGGHYTGHDGQSVLERHLNSRFPLTKAGRSIVFAAGNEGKEAIHAKATFAREPKLISWNAKEEAYLNIYFNSNNPNIAINPTKETPLGRNMSAGINPITKQYAATIKVAPGAGGIWLENSAGVSTDAHLYFFQSADGEYFGTFSPRNASYSYLVGAPGNMKNAITVGSFDWNDTFSLGGNSITLPSVCRDDTGKIMSIEIGFLSCYSSPGPNRNGWVKPDIVAPGQWYSSANAMDDGQTVGWGEPDSTGFYRRMNGTSAATPYTAGIIALMFQKKPALKLGTVKDLLKGKATKGGLNPFRDAVPNNNWGYGKLDKTAIDRIFAEL